MTGQYHAVLVNTQAEQSFDLQGPLQIGRPVNPVNGRFRQVYFKGWDARSDAATFDVVAPAGEHEWDHQTYQVTSAGDVSLISTVRQ